MSTRPIAGGLPARRDPAIEGSGSHLHWETALDRLELDVMLAERMLADPSRSHPLALEVWDEPQLDGPMPADLVARAVTIRERQLRVEAQLLRARGAIAEQQGFAERVDRATGRHPMRAIYLDVSA